MELKIIYNLIASTCCPHLMMASSTWWTGRLSASSPWRWQLQIHGWQPGRGPMSQPPSSWTAVTGTEIRVRYKVCPEIEIGRGQQKYESNLVKTPRYWWSCCTSADWSDPAPAPSSWPSLSIVTCNSLSNNYSSQLTAHLAAAGCSPSV